MNSVHRDDLSPEMLSMLEEQFPGMKIVCAGDVPESSLPPEVAKEIAEREAKNFRSLTEGRCLDCDVKMPGFPLNVVGCAEDWEPDEGWVWFEAGDKIVAWQCPNCDKGQNEIVCLSIEK